MTWYAPAPVTASIRRVPAPIPDSETILNRPISAVLRTWIPPQSSIEYVPAETTRTVSPYFSPNSAIAPFAFASAMFISSISTASDAQIAWLTSCSIVANSSAVTAPKCEKSKRRRSAETSEPAWLTCVPSVSFNALCNKWVAVWFFVMA